MSDKNDEVDESYTPAPVSTPSRRIDQRRRTNVSQTFKPEDISKIFDKNLALETPPEEALKINKKYQYRCKGEVERGSLLGKKVEWDASFDKPIDQLMYPSLQFFDMDAFNEKKKSYNKLHGHSDPQFSRGALPTPSRELVMSTKLFNTGVTLVKATTTANEITTPKWTVKLENTGKVFVKKEDIFTEIDASGENYLRSEMKKRHFKNLEQERKDEHDLKESQDILGNRFKAFRKKKWHDEESLSSREMAIRQADTLYRNLSVKSPSKLRSSLIFQKKQPEDMQSAHNFAQTRIYNEEKAKLEKTLPVGSEYSMEGFLFYRMRKEAHDSASLAEEDPEDSLTLASSLSKHQFKRHDYKAQTRLTQKLYSNGYQKVKSQDHDDDSSTARTLDMEILDTDLTRIRRALSTTRIGYDYRDMLEIDLNAMESPFPRSPKKTVTSKRLSQDTLLLSQLKAGIIPEQFVKKSLNPDNTVIDLSSFGIGDIHGRCLAEALTRLGALRTLGLRDNRLSTHAVAFMVRLFPKMGLLHLDLSRNDLHGPGFVQISSYVREKNSLEFLDVSNCNLDCSDVDPFWQAVFGGFAPLSTVILSDNRIRHQGISSLCRYLANSQCKLRNLDLAWNDIGSGGASNLAEALQLNKSLAKLDLTANSVQDHGGQRLASALYTNMTLQMLLLNQNNITGKTCFVFSKVLKDHPTMDRLDLSTNPLGEAGARSLFRTILRGLKCMIVMRNCEYRLDGHIFNHSNPGEDSPYSIELSEPYDSALLSELFTLASEDPLNCKFGNVLYKEHPKAKESSISLVAYKGEVVSKVTGQKWIIPSVGSMKVQFLYSIVVPTIEKAISARSLDILCTIVSTGKTEVDSKNWLKLLCYDVYLTTAQAQYMIDHFVEKRTIGAGGLSKLDVFLSIWSRLLDTENMYDFLCCHLDIEERKKLIYALSFERFKFNWLNPTGHWRFNLGDKVHRSVMLQLMAINYCESEYSRNLSRHDDTSQYGNWYNFRNASYSASTTEIFVIDKEFLSNLPNVGIIEFDYVSTTRPDLRHHTKPPEKEVLTFSSRPSSGILNSSSSDVEGRQRVNSAAYDSVEVTEVVGDNDLDVNDAIDVEENNDSFTSTIQRAPSGIKPSSAGEEGNDDIEEVEETNASRPSTANVSNFGDFDSSRPVTQANNPWNKIINDEEFYLLVDQMGLSNRRRATGSMAIFSLLELQLAATKYYFPTSKIISMLEYFGDDEKTQAKVVICLFSRVWDLYNFDFVMRQLDGGAQREVFLKIGCLNIVNPLKPNLDYVLSLLYVDNRILVHSLLEISASDCGDQILEDPRTELSCVALYGSSQRLLNEVRPEVMRFSFCEVGERSLNVSWTMRRDQVKRYLVGDYYSRNKEMYRIISMYREMESANFLARGPIELQYAQFIKSRSSASRKSTRLKTLVGAIKSTRGSNEEKK